MAHKVHPKAYRAKGVDSWLTKGFYRNPAKELEEDFRIREFLREKFKRSGLEKVEIERLQGKMNIIIYTSRPGLVIGRGGEGVEQIKKDLIKKVFKKISPQMFQKDQEKQDSKTVAVPFNIEIREVKNPWTSAVLCAEWVAQQIEKRINYRRVLKQAISKVMANKEIKGVKIEVSGRLNGAEIARKEWLKEGRLPRQTIRADIDYAQTEAHCTYGVIGIKVWLYKGEIENK